MRQVSQMNNVIKWMVVAIDMMVLNLLFLLFYSGRFTWMEHWNSENIKVLCLMYNLCYLFSATIHPPVLQMRKVRSDEIIRRVFTTVLWFAILAEICTGFIDHSLLDWWKNLLFFVTLCGLLICSRLTSRFVVKQMRKMGRNTHTAIFIGATDNMLELYKEMKEDPSSGYRVRGYFNDEKSPLFPENIPWLGKVDDVIPYLSAPENEVVQQAYCCLTSNRAKDIHAIINYCENHVVRFYSVPNVRNYLKRRMNMELLGDVPILYIREEPLQQLDNRIIKRLFDLFCSTLFLFTLFPLIYLVVALIIKITSPGPIFFKQKRNGLNGEEFYCYKFRSMKVNAQADTLQATENDPRKTKFGDFMRKTNIDELPQFINVFRGDMSLVGPRPHMLKHTEEYSELINKYMVRHLVKPGITGWAQVSGCRGETKELWQMEERVRKDIWYIENWTFWLDLRIMWMTVRNMLLHNEKMAY